MYDRNPGIKRLSMMYCEVTIRYHPRFTNPATPLAATTGPIPTEAAGTGPTSPTGQRRHGVEVTFRNGGGKLTLKHDVGFEVSAKASDMTFAETGEFSSSPPTPPA